MMPGVKNLKWLVLKIARKVIPRPIIEHMKAKRRVTRLKKIRQHTSVIDVSSLNAILKELDIKEGGCLFVHSASDYFAKIEGGPFVVLQSLLELMKRGTIAMPAFPFDGMASDYIKNNEFSIKKSASKMGLLTELLRRTPGVERSLHPTHSVCAKGEQAIHITADHHKSIEPFGEMSPFKRIVDMKGQILMIGVGIGYLTHVHTAEDELKDQFPVNVYLNNAKLATVVNAQGVKEEVKSLVHNPEVSIKKDIEQFEDELLELNIMRATSFAGIDFRVIDSEKLHNFFLNKAKLGKSIYN